MLRHAIGRISSNWRLFLISALALGCSEGKSEPIGFGKYLLGKTTPADDYVLGKCRPEGADTFCFLNRSPSIAGHKTQTDLYFRGHEDDAPLVEISVGVWNCQPEPVRADLQSKMGEPTQVAGKRAIWNLKKMTVIAQLPKDKELCMVFFLDKTETERIAELFPGTAPAPLPAAEAALPTEPPANAPAGNALAPANAPAGEAAAPVKASANAPSREAAAPTP